MQVFNLTKKTLFLLAAFSLSGLTLTAQDISMPQMPEMTQPSMPDMPVVSNPALSGDFYTPSFPNNSRINSTTPKLDSTDNSAAASLSSAATSEDFLTQLLTGSSGVSAADITTLYNSGLFSDLGQLESGTSTSSTNMLLQQILTQLEDLKKEQAKISSSQQQTLTNYEKDTQNFKSRNPNVLRFKINGYNIADTLTTVFVSETEPDGSFLLSGDRKYFTNQKQYTETFYLLFQAVKSQGNSISYQIQPELSQTELNKNSFVYKLCQQKNLTGQKTGNLVVIHSLNDDLSIDLLIDIDKR